MNKKALSSIAITLIVIASIVGVGGVVTVLEVTDVIDIIPEQLGYCLNNEPSTVEQYKNLFETVSMDGSAIISKLNNDVMIRTQDYGVLKYFCKTKSTYLISGETITLNPMNIQEGIILYDKFIPDEYGGKTMFLHCGSKNENIATAIFTDNEDKLKPFLDKIYECD